MWTNKDKRHMKTFGARLALPLLFMLFALPVAAQTREIYLAPTSKPMTVQDVIKLSKAGLSDDTIIEQIRTKRQPFELSTDQLLQLKAAKVSERVIQVMINPDFNSAPTGAAAGAKPAVQSTASSQSPSPASVKTEPQNPLPTEIGVYAKVKGTWIEVLPEVVNWKTGGVAKSVASVGIVKGDVNGHVNGAGSLNRLTAPVEFLIVVPEGVAITEYQLLRLHEHSGSREFRTVTGGVLHVSGGATRDLMSFDSKKIAPRTYEVSLAPSTGQYGFLPPGAIMAANAAASAGKVYSFGIIE
jgi:hypothetical protein